MQSALTILPQDQWNTLKDQAVILVRSGMLPESVKTPEAAIAIMLKGIELRLPPMAAFAMIHVIKRKPCLSAEGMLALIHRDCPGARISFPRYASDVCEVKASRPGQETATIVFTLDDAKVAGLMSNDNWKKYPRAMCRSRAVSEMARVMFPDIILGMKTPEEMAPEVAIDSYDQVIEAETTHAKPAPHEIGSGNTDARSNSAGVADEGNANRTRIVFDKTNAKTTGWVMQRISKRGFDHLVAFDIWSVVIEVLDGQETTADTVEKAIDDALAVLKPDEKETA